VGERKTKITLTIEERDWHHWVVYKFVDYYSNDDGFDYREDGPVEMVAEFPSRAKARAWLKEHRKEFELDV
jgi:hypothetical protein